MRRAAASWAATSAAGGMQGRDDGTRTSPGACAKKQTRRPQPAPSLHSAVLYRVGWSQYSNTEWEAGQASPRAQVPPAFMAAQAMPVYGVMGVVVAAAAGVPGTPPDAPPVCWGWKLRRRAFSPGWAKGHSVQSWTNRFAQGMI
jgi:hypothetical protein